ncbi:MAG TPA: hypothetical protein VLF68_02150 [Candidatus Saccharimonadales bacterium]|nr:hypothetical protein [Candidatus Saccharimonadales bacterium]
MAIDAIGFQINDGQIYTNTIKGFEGLTAMKLTITSGAAMIAPPARAQARYCEMATTDNGIADENVWALANRAPLGSWAACPGAQPSSQANPSSPSSGGGTSAPNAAPETKGGERRPTGTAGSGSFKAHEPVAGKVVTLNGVDLKPQPCYLPDPQSDGSVQNGVVNPWLPEVADMAKCNA